jgi:hypothetical protein
LFIHFFSFVCVDFLASIARLADNKVGKAKAQTGMLSQLKLSGSKRLPDGFKVNYEIRTGSSDKSAFVETTSTQQDQMNEFNAKSPAFSTAAVYVASA